MLKVSRLETPFQEIIFLLTIIFSFSIGVGGIFYLNLSPESLTKAIGVAGSSLIRSIFHGFGYSYFLLILFCIHFGHIILKTVNTPGDLLPGYRKYFTSLSIDLTILLLISSFIAVFEFYNGWEPGTGLAYGYGGWFGYHIGGFLFTNFGFYGALMILFSMISVIGISAGYMEIVHSFYVTRDICREIFQNLQVQGPQVLKNLRNSLLDFIHQKPAYAQGIFQYSREAHFDFQSLHKGISPVIHAGRMITDHFHLPQVKPKARLPKELTGHSENVTNKKTSHLDPKSQTALQTDRSQWKDQDDQKLKVQEESRLTDNKKSRSKKTNSPLKSKTTEVQKVSKTETVLEEPTKEQESRKSKDECVIKHWTKRYKKLEPGLLEKPEKRKPLSENRIRELCDLLKEQLESFGIKGEILKAHQGVTLTLFEFKPAPGVKLSKIQSLADDLALVLGARSIRMLTPIPGKTTVGIEVPNQETVTLRFSELIADCMKKRTMALPIPMGLDVYNKVHVNDLAKMPHLLISGTTGSGKSVFMNNLISGLISHKSPKQLRFLMIDPKMIELSPYNGIPHLVKPVVTDVDTAKDLLLWAEREMDKRYRIFSEMQSKNLISFNQAIKKSSKRVLEARLARKITWDFVEMPYLVVIIDELADLMLTHRGEVERPITRLAQKARAAGIHLVVATQRPSSEIVTGLIKTNFPTRVSFKVSSAIDSRTILGQPGADKLLGQGDMLFMPQGKALERLQGGFLTENEVKKVVRSVVSQA